MKSLGLFRLLVPNEYGGEEMDWLEYLDVVRTIAYADGSVAWCFNQGTVFVTTSCRAPKALANEVWGDAMTVVSNGPPKGVTAEPVEGGTRLNGQWMFSSGCRHANWVAAVSPRPGRLHLIPRDQVEFVDVWQVPGLRGTGSFPSRHTIFSSRLSTRWRSMSRRAWRVRFTSCRRGSSLPAGSPVLRSAWHERRSMRPKRSPRRKRRSSARNRWPNIRSYR